MQADFTCLFVGKLIPLHGLETILEAARLAPELLFRVVGSGQLDSLAAADYGGAARAPVARLPRIVSKPWSGISLPTKRQVKSACTCHPGVKTVPQRQQGGKHPPVRAPSWRENAPFVCVRRRRDQRRENAARIECVLSMRATRDQRGEAAASSTEGVGERDEWVEHDGPSARATALGGRGGGSGRGPSTTSTSKSGVGAAEQRQLGAREP